MSRRNLILLAIAVVVIGIYLTVRFDQTDTTVQEQALIQVVVAKHDIAPYEVISADDLREEMVPAAFVGSEALVTWAEMRGKRLITNQDLRKGSILRWTEVLEVPEDWQSGQMLISSFYAPTDRVVGGQVRPGHRIDLLVARPGAVESSESLWLAHDLWVVGVNQSSGTEIQRPAVVNYEEADANETPQATSGGLFGIGASTTGSTSSASAYRQDGISNLVTVATDRETARMMSYYLGARLYDAWVYVRPEALAMDEQSNGTLQGLVYGDSNHSGRFDADEAGLEGVTLRLYDSDGMMVNTLTDESGQFQFRDIAPGTYTLEEIDPAGHTSLTPNRRTIYVAEDQNLYVAYADSPDIAREMGVVTVPQTVTVTQVITQPIYEHEPVIKLDVMVASSEGGSPMSEFPQDTNQVWAKIVFEDTPENLAYSVSVKQAGAAEYWVADGQRQEAAEQWVALSAPGGATTFAEGFWMVIVRTGAEETIRGFAEWHVDPPASTGTVTPDYPRTGGVLLGGH